MGVAPAAQTRQAAGEQQSGVIGVSESPVNDEYRRCISEALTVLGVKNLVLAIHDSSYPSAPGENTGRGSPYARGGMDFLRFARNLGFNGIQFGPQGQTTAGNRSPYDGTLFSKNILSIALFDLAADPSWQGILPVTLAEAAVSKRPVSGSNAELHTYLHDVYDKALRVAYEAFLTARTSAAMQPLAEQLTAFTQQHHEWLERDAENAAATGFHTFCQFVLDRHHQDLRHRARDLGLKLFGDLQIGISTQDRRAHRSLFLTDYVMGAPPSRTNPMGQPWNYPVLDPDQYGPSSSAPGPALAFIDARIDKMLSEFDGVRIDHPHGLVCPWVYHAQASDPFEAVRNGARLFESPHLPDHPALARYAIPSLDQLHRNALRYADDWVSDLSAAQIERYAIAFDCIVQAVRRRHREISDILCEVLSTQPFPLEKVLAHYRLGRFRVTQKADLKNPGDVYRSENAAPEDWIMVGNHDTKPIWLLAESWRAAGTIEARASYLAGRLIPDPSERHAFARKLALDPRAAAQAMCADILASPAQNVMIFFPDLFGLKTIYNAPGIVNDENWSLRVPDDYEPFYIARAASGEALNIPLVLAMALRARGPEVCVAYKGLLERLDARAMAFTG